MDPNAYKKCEFIIRRFLSVGEPSPELSVRFHAWPLDGRHCREKNILFQKLFDETFADKNPMPICSEERSALKRKIPTKI